MLFKTATAAVGLPFLYKTIPDCGLIGDKPFAGLPLLATLTATDLNHSIFPCVKMIDILTHTQTETVGKHLGILVGTSVSYQDSAKSVCFWLRVFANYKNINIHSFLITG